MASPGLVRLAITTSVAMTGAAAYYYLSEGGDPEKLDSNLRDTRAKIDSTVASARAWTEQTAEAVKSHQDALPIPSVNAKEQNAVEGRSEGTEAERSERLRKSETPERQTGARCHTCSGPRIWFFAEKLRLKRRITPYPDPQRD